MSEEMVGQRESFLRGYDEGYFDAIKAALERAINIAKRNGFENEGKSGIMCMVGYLSDIQNKDKRTT